MRHFVGMKNVQMSESPVCAHVGGTLVIHIDECIRVMVAPKTGSLEIFSMMLSLVAPMFFTDILAYTHRIKKEEKR